MRVLLTGGFGCIGSWITKQLLDQGADLWVYDLREDHSRMELVLRREQLSDVTFVAGDVTNFEHVTSTLREFGISHVIHLAGLQVPTCRANPKLGASVNVLGTLCMFEAMRQLTPQIQRLVYASSAAVYGPPEAYSEGSLAEDVRLAPSTHYGAFKICNESNARVYWQDHKVSSIGLRPWTVYGVGRDQGITSEPTKAIKSVVLGRSYHITYGGWQDLQFVEDVAGTFIRCTEAPYEGAGVYNLRGSVVDLPEFCRTLAEVAPEAGELITHGEQQLPIAYDLDNSRLLNDFERIPRTPLAEGIRRTLDHFRSLQAEGRLDTSDLAK